jgi:hypothetical protein
MKVLFYTVDAYLIFEAQDQVMTDSFDFSRSRTLGPDTQEDYVDLYRGFLNSTRFVEGDSMQISLAFVTFVRGIAVATDDIATMIREHLVVKDPLVYGLVGEIAASKDQLGFSIAAMDEEEFAEQASLHRSFGAAAHTGLMQ